MRTAWKEMCSLSMGFAGQCGFDRFVSITNKYREAWEEDSRACRKGSRRRMSGAAKDGQKDGTPTKRRCSDASSGASARKRGPLRPDDLVAPMMMTHSMMGVGGGGAAVAGGGMRPPLSSPFFVPALHSHQGHLSVPPGMPGVADAHGHSSHQQQQAMALAMQQMLGGTRVFGVEGWGSRVWLRVSVLVTGSSSRRWH